MSAEKQTSPQASLKNRRFYSRRDVRSLAYIDLGRDNGGIVLNVSEGGLAIHSAIVLSDRRLPQIRFQLPQSTEWIEARGEVAWTSESRMQAGIQLIGLTDNARKQIRDWVASSGRAASLEMPRTDAAERRPLTSLRVEKIPTPAMPPDPPFPVSLPRPHLAISQPPATSNGESTQSSAPLAVTNTANGSNGSNGSKEIVSRMPASPVTLRTTLNAGTQLGLRLGQAAAQPKSQPPWKNWVGFAAFLTGMAVLSFFAGLRTGKGDSRSLVTGLFSGTARSDSTTASRPSSDSASTNTVDGSESAMPMLGRITVSSRLYIPVFMPSGSGDSKTNRLQVGAIIYRPDPLYPTDAQKHHTEGTVQLHATIGASGSVENVAVLSGPPALVDAASSAVRQWRFKPTQLDGKAIGTEAEIAIVFWLRPAPPSHPQSESK